MKKILKYSFILLITAFTLLTLFLSSSIIFDLFGIREKEGNYVLFVVFSNFIASLLYLYSILLFLKDKKKAHLPIVIAVLILIGAQIGLHFHIQAGGLFETRTVHALYFRIILSSIFAFTLRYFQKNNEK